MSAATKSIKASDSQQPLKDLPPSAVNSEVAHEALSHDLTGAAATGDLELVSRLLDLGADVDAKRHDGFTPLLLAAFFGQFEIVRLLVARGANVGITSRFGTSAEMWATARGFSEISKFLRETIAARSNGNSLAVPIGPPPKQIADEQQKPAASLPLNDSALDPEVTLLKPHSSPDVIIHSSPRVIINEEKQEEAQVLRSPSATKQRKSSPTTRILDENWEPNPLVELSTVKHRSGMVFAERITQRAGMLIVVAVAVMLASGLVTYAILKRERRAAKQSATVITTPVADSKSPSSIQQSQPLNATAVDSKVPESPPTSSAVETNIEPVATDSFALNDATQKLESPDVKPGVMPKTTTRFSYRSGRTISARQNKRPIEARNQPDSTLTSPQSSNTQRANVSLAQPTNEASRTREVYNSTEIISPNRKTKVIQWP